MSHKDGCMKRLGGPSLRSRRSLKCTCSSIRNSSTFETLPLQVFRQIRKSLRPFDHREMRKTTKVWSLCVPQGHLRIYGHQLEEFNKNLCMSRTFLNFKLVEFDSLCDHGLRRAAAIMPTLGEKIERLKIHSLDNMHLITSTQLEEFIKLMPNLGSIEGSGIRFEASGGLLGMPNAAIGCAFTFDGVLRNGRLMLTSVSWFCVQNALNFNEVLSAHANTLVELKLEATNGYVLSAVAGSRWASTISQLIRLRRLHLHSNNVQLAQLFVKYLPSTVQLEKFDSSRHTITPQLLDTFFQRWGRTLDLFTFNFVHSENLDDFLKCLRYTGTNLKYLSLRISNAALFGQLGKHLPADVSANLQHLICGSCEKWNDQASFEFLSKLRNLTFLVTCAVGTNVAQTERALVAIFEHLTKLSLLAFCTDIELKNPDTFKTIGRLKRLESFNIRANFDKSMLKTAIAYMLQLPRLRRLDGTEEFQKIAAAMLQDNATAELRYRLTGKSTIAGSSVAST